jgi:hypothetical protein
VFFIALLGGNQGFANTTSGRSSIVLLGWFGGAVAHIIFGFFAAIVLDAVDTMVMCYAIDKDNGFSQADYSKKDPVVATLYASFDNLVKEHGDLSNVAMATTSIATASSVPVESQKVRVTIPQGVMAGQKLKATAPDGMVFEIIVPEGCVPGQVLEVDRSTA